MAQYVYTMNRVGKTVPPKRQILKDISLSFFPGAKIGVLGLNGAGKSTLLKIPSRINSTWGGNLVDMVRGTRIIEVIEEEGLLEHTTRQGQRLLSGLQAIHRDLPEFTSNPRGRGLFCAMDLATPELRAATISKAQERGMIVLASGQTGLRFRPALNLKTEDLDLGLTLLRECLIAARG